MDRMTEDRESDAVAAFYDALAPGYDRMTGFANRFAVEAPAYKRIVETYRIHSAIDAGAGTGFHSIMLAQSGVQVTAVDRSASMLDRLRQHAVSYGVSVNTIVGGFETIPANLQNPVDAVFCLGNTIAHLRTEEEVLLALGGFRGALRQGGILVLQLLNYERILRSRERIQNVKQEGDEIFIRMYDFEGEEIRFNIVRLQGSAGKWSHSMQSVPLYPWTAGKLVPVLARAGFSGAKLFGGVTMEPYSPDSSRDLVVMTQRT